MLTIKIILLVFNSFLLIHTYTRLPRERTKCSACTSCKYSWKQHCQHFQHCQNFRHFQHCQIFIFRCEVNRLLAQKALNSRLDCLYFIWIGDVLHKPCTTVILRSPVAARFRILGHAVVVAAHLEVGNWNSSGSPHMVLAWPASHLYPKSCTWTRFLLISCWQ